MPNESRQQIAEELQQSLGALDVFFTLRDEFATWLKEAQDEPAKQCGCKLGEKKVSELADQIEMLTGKHREPWSVHL